MIHRSVFFDKVYHITQTTIPQTMLQTCIAEPRISEYIIHTNQLLDTLSPSCIGQESWQSTTTCKVQGIDVKECERIFTERQQWWCSLWWSKSCKF